MDHAGADHASSGPTCCHGQDKGFVVLAEQVLAGGVPTSGQRQTFPLESLVVVAADQCPPSMVELCRGPTGFGIALTRDARVASLPTAPDGTLGMAQVAGVMRGQQLESIDGVRVRDATTALGLLREKALGQTALFHFQSKQRKASRPKAKGKSRR